MMNIQGKAPERYMTVLRSLRDGYGVEDIAKMHRIPIDRVRAHVAAMRRNGVLKVIFKPGCDV